MQVGFRREKAFCFLMCFINKENTVTYICIYVWICAYTFVFIYMYALGFLLS